MEPQIANRQPGLQTQVYRLNSELEQDAWNSFVQQCEQKIVHELKLTNIRDPNRFSMSGLSYAELSENRTDPHVAVVSFERIENKQWDMENVVAFVPYSVLRDSAGRTLVVPMGLTKLTYRVRQGNRFEVKGVFRHLMGAIADFHGKTAIMTRFAHDKGPIQEGASAFEENHMFRVWSNQFPGKLRLDWVVYTADEFDESTIDELNSQYDKTELLLKRAKKEKNTQEISRLKRLLDDINEQIEEEEENDSRPTNSVTTRRGAWEKDKPESYDPGLGGAAYQDGTFTVTSHEGDVIFQWPHAKDNKTLKEFISREFCYHLGCLVTAWTA